MTYRLIRLHGTPGIQGLLCGHTSFHPMDIQERFCGFCHLFHKETAHGD